MIIVTLCTANVARLSSLVLDGAATGSGVSSVVSNGSPSVITSGAVFDALPTTTSYPMIVSLGTLTDVESQGNLVMDSGTVRVLMPGTVSMVGRTSQPLPYSVSRPWVNRTASTTSVWKNIGFGNGLFVAVGGNDIGSAGGIMTSPDGNVWTNRSTSIGTEFRSMCFGGGRFVAVVGLSSGLSI